MIGSGYSESFKDEVFEKGQKFKRPGDTDYFKPKLYRLDCCGNVIYRYSYGLKTKLGWEIDHKNPKSLGGSNDITNLQPLQYDHNREKSNDSKYIPQQSLGYSVVEYFKHH